MTPKVIADGYVSYTAQAQPKNVSNVYEKIWEGGMKGSNERKKLKIMSGCIAVYIVVNGCLQYIGLVLYSKNLALEF